MKIQSLPILLPRLQFTHKPLAGSKCNSHTSEPQSAHVFILPARPHIMHTPIDSFAIPNTMNYFSDFFLRSLPTCLGGSSLTFIAEFSLEMAERMSSCKVGTASSDSGLMLIESSRLLTFTKPPPIICAISLAFYFRNILLKNVCIN